MLISTSPLYCQAVNSASGASGVAPGSLVSWYGIFPLAQGEAQSIPLPTRVGQVYFFLWDVSSGLIGPAVPLLYWSPSQINLVLPSSATAGRYLQASSPVTGTSINVSLNVLLQAPGIFLNPTSDCSISAAGCGQKLLRGILTDSNYALINSGNPAHPGQSFVIWITGLGVAPTAPEVSIMPSTGSPVAATVFYAGHTSFAGLDQVNVTLPGGNALAPGCSIGAHVEVQLSMKSVITGVQSNTVSVPVITDSCN
jgi:uncharacterized protein (TIGR03437 family)